MTLYLGHIHNYLVFGLLNWSLIHQTSCSDLAHDSLHIITAPDQTAPWKQIGLEQHIPHSTQHSQNEHSPDWHAGTETFYSAEAAIIVTL